MNENTYTTNNEASGAFFIIPKTLMNNPKYASLKTNAIMLYGLMLDRKRLSEMNNLRDENGEIYIIFTIKSISEAMTCTSSTAVNYLNTLEKCGLIRKKRLGNGIPTHYYINEPKPYQKTITPDIKNHMPTMLKINTEPYQKSNTNNTENNNTEFSNTLFTVEDEVKENIDYDYLVTAECKEDVDSIVSIITDTLSSHSKHIHIGAEVFGREEVRKRLMSLNDNHISYVLEALHTGKSQIRDIRAYILKLLFYAPTTMNIYYSALYDFDRNTFFSEQ